MTKPVNNDINRINPNKLLNSKWTSLAPVDKEKHFLVVGVDTDERDIVTTCCLQAVLTRHEYSIDWRELKDKTRWSAGWC